MTAKERGNYIKELLSTLTAKEEKILRSYFGINIAKRYTLEEISKGDQSSREKIKKIKNNGVKTFRDRVINLRKIVAQEKQGTFLNDKERLMVTCNKLKEYLEAVRPELINKSLPLHYSNYLDEFMLTLIDELTGVVIIKEKTCFDH